jgi:hypothetical protein
MYVSITAQAFDYSNIDRYDKTHRERRGNK